MGLNFFNNFKNNFLFLKGKLSLSNNNLNVLSVSFIINLIIFIFTLDLFLSLNIFNLFYSFINYVFNINYIVLLTVLFLISIKSLLLDMLNFNLVNRFNVNNESSYNNIYLMYLYCVYNKLSYRTNISFLFNYIYFVVISSLSNSYIFNFISSYLFNLLRPVYWYPIFKRHSIFGYYRIARQNWVELRTEEVNYLKY